MPWYAVRDARTPLSLRVTTVLVEAEDEAAAKDAAVPGLDLP